MTKFKLQNSVAKSSSKAIRAKFEWQQKWNGKKNCDGKTQWFGGVRLNSQILAKV